MIKLPSSLTTVTPFSKLLAGILFIVFIISAFFAGMGYQSLNYKTNYIYKPSPSLTTNKISSGSGIYGKAVIGPQCPAMNVNATQEEKEQCKDKPYKATIVATANDSAKQITVFTTDNNGEFDVLLPPGTYLLQSKAGTDIEPIFLKPVTVVVAQNKKTEVILLFDSGIR